MEIPYSTLLRISWALWWRFHVVLCVVCVLLAAPLGVAGMAYPILWDALAASQIDRDFFFLAVIPAFELLVCLPFATRWFQRSCASALRVTVRYTGGNPGITGNKDRQLFLFAWAIWWIPLLWEIANALLIHALFPGHSGGWPIWGAIIAIRANVALLQLLAFLPMNLNWALASSLLGIEWRLGVEGNAPTS